MTRTFRVLRRPRSSDRVQMDALLPLDVQIDPVPYSSEGYPCACGAVYRIAPECVRTLAAQHAVVRERIAEHGGVYDAWFVCGCMGEFVEQEVAA